MYLNYSELEFDQYGNPERPELVLETMSGDVIGVIPSVSNLKFCVKYSEPSTISFNVASVTESGDINPMYDQIDGYKLIYTKHYGVYVLMNPTRTSDGMADSKRVEGFSLEKTLDTKRFFIEDGTYRFCDINDTSSSDTVIGRILEKAVGWSVGTIDPDVAQRYRTFDQYDEYLLSFIYGDATEKFRAAFVFDTYNKTISVYDADKTRNTLPIYLDFDNLVKQVEVSEKSDELVTALSPYGADELNIRDVNPIGSNWLYNLSYFIGNGSIPTELATKWNAWKAEIAANQQAFKGYVSLMASATARLTAEQVRLTELNGELDTLTAQQSLKIQEYAMASESARPDKQAELDAINTSIAAKQEEIDYCQAVIDDIERDLAPSDSSDSNVLHIPITSAIYGYKYRCIVTNSSGSSITSGEAQVLQTTPDILITQQPVDYIGSVGDTMAFTVVAESNDPSNTLSYQWQWLNSQGVWSDQNYTSFKKATLNVSLTAARVGYQYRCRVMDSNSHSVISVPVTARTGDPSSTFAITEQPVDYVGSTGDVAEFTVTASGQGITYRWQWYDGSTWRNVYTSYRAQIEEIVDELAMENYFTSAEYAALSHYLIEQDMTEETFVGTTIDSGKAAVGNTDTLDDSATSPVEITGASIERVDISDVGKTVYVITGGSFEIERSYEEESEGQNGETVYTTSYYSLCSGDIIRGTLEVKPSESSFVMSFYTGTVTKKTALSYDAPENTYESGVLNICGNYTVAGIDDDTALEFVVHDGNMYLTTNVSEYQQYSVEEELYDYAVNVLHEASWPTYEFSVDAGNFVFAHEFCPFRDSLELGCGIYLNVPGGVITPYLLEIEFDFENTGNFSMTFSNRFKRYDNVNVFSDMVEKSYSSSRSFDAKKYISNQVENQATMVSEFMRSSLDAAVNSILAAKNQSVVIDGAGVHVGMGGSNSKMRIVNNMIAMTDDNWSHAKLAIGEFRTPDNGTYFGVNAEVIAGRLIVGNSMVLENPQVDGQGQQTGVMQFKVDGSGVWLNNSTFVLQKDNGGKIIIDPKYGILGGKGSLYTVSGTTVTPSFVDNNGDVELQSDGFPANTNFFLDIRNGNAYFRGNVTATSGTIGGFTIATNCLHAGSGNSYVALDGSTSDTNSSYAIWAGDADPSDAPFSVTKSGSLTAQNGDFDSCRMDSCYFGRMNEYDGGTFYAPVIEADRFAVNTKIGGSAGANAGFYIKDARNNDFFFIKPTSNSSAITLGTVYSGGASYLCIESPEQLSLSTTRGSINIGLGSTATIFIGSENIVEDTKTQDIYFTAGTIHFDDVGTVTGLTVPATFG